ncbi:MAG: leucine-rich repeat domain-containing protein, partial [Verrucomicrobia bacterium]
MNRRISLRKITIATLALLILLALPTYLQAELLYTSDGISIAITGSNPKATGTLFIPETINGLPVTSIGQDAFYGCSGLTNVTISTSVMSIADRAFAHCTGLTSVKIPNSVTSIGQ